MMFAINEVTLDEIVEFVTIDENEDLDLTNDNDQKFYIKLKQLNNIDYTG